jgi:hypothetical protein
VRGRPRRHDVHDVQYIPAPHKDFNLTPRRPATSINYCLLRSCCDLLVSKSSIANCTVPSCSTSIAISRRSKVCKSRRLRSDSTSRSNLSSSVLPGSNGNATGSILHSSNARYPDTIAACYYQLVQYDHSPHWLDGVHRDRPDVVPTAERPHIDMNEGSPALRNSPAR